MSQSGQQTSPVTFDHKHVADSHTIEAEDHEERTSPQEMADRHGCWKGGRIST